MDFDLTDEQNAIFDMAKSFAEEAIAPHAIAWDQERHFPLDVIRNTAELGMAGIYVSEDHGGSGLSRLDATLIFEALSMACPATAAFLSIHNMVAGMIDRFAGEEMRAGILPRLCSMDLVASYCLTEPGSGSDAAALRTSAKRDGDGWVLNGTKAFISGGGVSDLYVVMARSGDEGPKGISAFLVEAGTPGLSFGAAEKKMGWHVQPTAQVNFDDCRIPAQNLLGEEGKGFSYAMAGLDGGRLNIAACALGGAQSALDKTRRLHGRAQGLRQAARRDAGPAVPPRRHGNRVAGGPRLPAPGGLQARPARARRDETLRHGQAFRHRRGLQGRQ